MPGDKPVSGLDTTVAPVSGLDPTVAPPHRKASLEAVGPTVAPGVDLPDLPIIDGGLYTIGTEIGRGGMGRVLAARDRKLRRDVVIKVLHPGAPTPRFQREALITAKLQHPSIVRVYDAGWLAGEQPFYAMERVRGMSLDRVVANADDFRARLTLLPHVIAVAEAIAYAHSEGVIHRDLKPNNVLVGSFGETVVIDWGLAKDLRSTDVDSIDPRMPTAGADDQTVAGAVMGTPAFMPPEQARGELADERSDIYAIGALLYSVLSGSPPVSGERALEDASAGSITPLREREPEVSPELASIVERAMAFSPLDRYGSAKDLADELKRYTTGQLVSSHTYSTAMLLRRWFRRHRTVLAVAGIATLLLVGLGVFSLREIMQKSELAEDRAREVSRQMDLVKQRSDELRMDHAESVLVSDPSLAIGLMRGLTAEAMSSDRALDIAGTAAVNGVGFQLSGPRDDVEQLVLGKNGTAFTGSDDGHLWGWSIPSKRGDDLGHHTGPIEAIAIASNGLMLVTGGTDTTVRLWDLVTGQSKVLTGHTAAVRGLAFAPDNLSFVSTSEDHTLRQWSVASGEGKVLVTDQHALRPIAWSADGARVWTGTGDGRIVEIDLATGKSRTLPVHKEAVRVLAISPDGTKLASGAEDGLVLVTTLADQRAKQIAQHADVVRDLVWAGEALLSAGGDTRIVVTSPSKQLELMGNTSGVKDLALSQDGSLVAAAGIDGVARVWKITGGEPREFRGHRASVKAIEFTADNTTLITTSDDDRVRVWPLARPEPPPRGRALATWIEKHTNLR
ncbi:MAG: protein kinase [Myxococcota bacterium]|nr:protein kinase [Myxococcota bacterium]